MICYSPLWKTMAEKQMTTYTLRFKYGMSHATVQRLQADMPVSTHTLNKLCEILQCRLEDVAVYIPDQKMTALRPECRAVFWFYKDSKDFSLAPGVYEGVRTSS